MSERKQPRRRTVDFTEILALGQALRTAVVISTPQQGGRDAKSPSSDDDEDEEPLQLFVPSTDPKDVAEAEERRARSSRFAEQWAELTRAREAERRRAAEAAEAERRRRRLQRRRHGSTHCGSRRWRCSVKTWLWTQWQACSRRGLLGGDGREGRVIMCTVSHALSVSNEADTTPV